MCIHTGFLTIRSWRVNQRSRMFVGDQRSLNPQLSPNFNVDGSKAEVTTMVRTKPETTKRKKHLAPPTSTNQAPLNADALLD